MGSLSPLYRLRDVADLAKAGKVSFSPRATIHYGQLGYTLAQAKECIACICESEFLNVRDYGDRDKFDAYITMHRGPDGIIRKLYVKFKIPTPASVDYVFVTSFHIPDYP